MTSPASREEVPSTTRQAADVSPLLRPPLTPALRRPLSPSSSTIKVTNWLPTSLTRTYLFSLAVLSLALGVCCFTLVAYSHMHNGLSSASSTAGFRFNQRYLPTFVTVLYALLWKPVVVDIIRTEPWALLSLPVAPRAKDALLRRDKMWWSHVADAIRNRERPGGVRWALLISIVAGLVASIVINPLSAGLFDTSNILVTRDRQFSRIVPSTSVASAPRIGDITYLRAVTNMFYNVSTSAWNTDEYTVAPFWPSNLEDAPMGTSLAHLPQLWVGSGEVLSAQVNCRLFTIGVNETTPYGTNDTWTGLSSLQTDDGCAVTLTHTSQYCGTGIWSQISNISSPTTLENCSAQGYREYFVFCSQNASRTALLRQGMDKNDKKYYAGQVCNTSYFTASIPVNVSTTSSGSVVSFDESTFVKERHPMDSTSFNISEFEDQFILQIGSNHLRPKLAVGLNMNGQDENSNFEGPSLVLAASNNYSVDRLMQADPAVLAKQAGVIKQRFFGEVLLSGFNELATKHKTSIYDGSVIEQQFRLVLDFGIGATIGILFILLAGAAIALAFQVRLSRRPLQLSRDPNMSSTAAAVLDDAESSSCFKNLDRHLPAEIDTTLQDLSFIMRNGMLTCLEGDLHLPVPKSPNQNYSKPKCHWFGRHKKSSKKSDQDWRPFTLRRRSGSLLAVLLFCVTAALSTIYAISRKRPLYQSALVYQSDLNIGNLDVTTLAPYSILPTLMAVAIKLWWTTIDSAYRRLTPFLAMARSPAPPASGGAALSYITTPICWITLLALRKGYWLLALVTFSTLTSEVLQISMSALWSRELGVLNMDTTLSSLLEIRSVAHVFEDSRALYRSATSIAYPNIAQHLYGGELYQTSWVYGSLAEMAFGASPPAWSKDGWSFPPVDLSGVAKNLPKLASNNGTEASNLALSSSLNVTFDTIGLRGRVDCTPIEDTSQWVIEVKNLANISLYNSSWTDNRPAISSGFELSSRVRVVNFTNFDASRPDTVTIGQWLHANYSSKIDQGDPLYQPDNKLNFTVLWINASYPYLYESNVTGTARYVIKDLPPRLIFAQRPQVQALDCQPVFETAEANIVVSTGKGKVEELTLLKPATPITDAWSDKFMKHYSNATAYYEGVPAGGTLNEMSYYNTTVSWGYLFQLALLQACNVQGFVTGTGDYLGEGIPGPTPFSFIEPDLYSDPYSYASLALMNYNRTAPLNADTLANVTQHVFSNFFQWFVSSKSGYTGDYWAYQSLDTISPPDLDFGLLETWVTQTETFSRITTLCEYVWVTHETVYTANGATRPLPEASCVKPTLTSSSIWTTTHTDWTIVDTRMPLSSSLPSASMILSQATAKSLVTAEPQPQKRTTPSNARAIKATVSVRTETLVISPPALFMSISIILLLLLSIFVVYILQYNQLRLLPHDFDSLASVFAAVYASNKLKAWAKRQHERGGAGGYKRKTGAVEVDEDIAVKMGYFIGVDGEEHWGIEVVEDNPSLLEKAHSMTESAVGDEESHSNLSRRSDHVSI